MKDMTAASVDSVIDNCRDARREVEREEKTVNEEEQQGMAETEHMEGPDTCSLETHCNSNDEEVHPYKRPHLSPPPLDRPSEYLRSRCPLCFGGSYPDIRHNLQ
jgi:hypothetical protein